MTDALVTVTQFGGNAEVIEWFRVVRAAYDGADTPADFPSQLRQHAEAFDQTMVEEFLRSLSDTADTGGALVELLALEDQMPDLYWAYFPAEHTEESTGHDTDPFGWVEESQAAQLNSAWGGDWRAHMDEQLTPRWGADWQAHPADHKHAWLTDLLPELLAPQEEPPQEEPPGEGSFDWVTGDQGGRLATAWGSDWQTHLDAQLTPRWGADWQSHPAEHKQAWLTDLLPELLGATETADSAAHSEISPDLAQEVSTLLDGLLTEELANVSEDSDLSPEELTELFAELRADLLDTPTPQEDRS